MGMVVIGSVFVDMKGYPEGDYLPGGRNAGRVEQAQGGVARNIAEDLARAGEAVTFVGLVDESGAGADVLTRLAHSGVDARYVRRVPGGMGLWLAVFDQRGDVAAAISQRPNLRPIGGILDAQGDEIFAKAEGILLELDLEPETVERVYRLAEAHRVPVYAAVSNIRIALENRAYLPRTDCFVCNEQEASILFPQLPADLDPAEMASAVKEAAAALGLPRVVVTLAERGAVYADACSCGHVPAEDTPVVDTTGAGDAFFAGVCAGLRRGLSLRDACALGSQLAASVIRGTDNVVPVQG